MLIKRIKNEAKIIKKILDKDKNLKFYNRVENIGIFLGFFSSFIMVSILSYFYFDPSNILINIGALFVIFIFSGCILGYLKYAILEFFFEIYKNKILDKKNDFYNNYNKVFSYKYYVNKKELIKYKNFYKSLSKNAQLALKIVTINSKKNSIEDIEKSIFEEEIMEKSLSEFINYAKIEFDSDIKEIKINKSQLIEMKLNKELKNINKENFLKYKDDIIYLSGKIENKVVEYKSGAFSHALAVS